MLVWAERCFLQVCDQKADKPVTIATETGQNTDPSGHVSVRSADSPTTVSETSGGSRLLRSSFS